MTAPFKKPANVFASRPRWFVDAISVPEGASTAIAAVATVA